ncbi:NAD(P)H-dependent amine dehydrogenase family protein [Yinghuangia sp. YIM S10712]|uniref:NAD(P)H-dependent amine dehydrogenase family protein n=1 Tax=Yinghuangia sp. YIM S10712 TaxID=3436930 RepID=UPI003F52B3E0
MEKLRVIQWTTGKVGKLALRAIIDDPRLELVGVYAWSPDKNGIDAGELCGRPHCGVTATNDVDALVALGADTVIYTPFMADLDHVLPLLESGADVISTNLFFNVGGIQGETKERLEAACVRGGSALFITGVNPGWINSVVTAMTAVCRDVRMVAIHESADCSVYESAETWLAMGISLSETTPEVAETARTWMMSFHDAVHRMAAALGYTLDDTEFFLGHATASQTVDLGWLRIEKGTNAALRAGWNGKVGGRTVVQSNVAWYLTKHLNEGWEFDDDQYRLVIEGEPGIQSRIRFLPPDHWGNHEWDTMTALPAVNAAFNVKAAKPGILQLSDVGLPVAPAGKWHAART